VQFESEARHHATYTRLAHHYQKPSVVERRLEELYDAEAAIMSVGEPRARMHS
jgi:tRNA-(ms[2]io[6]A)-hydroxylase